METIYYRYWPLERTFKCDCPDVELDLQFARFDLAVDVSQLANKRFVTTRTHLDGVKFYYRATRKVSELCNVAGLPPIGNQAMPPPVDHCREQTETANADTSKSPPSDIWKVELTNIELTNVTDVWLDTCRLQGKGVVGDSSFFIWPGQRIMVDARTSHWSTMQAHVSGKQVAEHASIDAAVKIDDVDLDDAAAIWRSTSGTVTIGGLDGRLEPFGDVEGMYRLSAEAIVEHGEPTHVAVSGQVPSLTIHVGDKRLSGSLDVHARGHTGHSPKRLDIVDSSARLGNITVDGEPFPRDILHAEVLRGGYFDVRRKIFEFDVASTCTSIAPALALLPSGFGPAMTKIIVRDNDPLTIAIHFVGPWGHMAADPFSVAGGSLEATGTIAVSPKLDGRAKVSLGPLSKTIEIN